MKSFQNLIDKATRATIQQDRQIKQLISRIVPATTLAHIEFCRVEGGRLRVTVDNAAWVAKLRFSERQLLGALREGRMDVYSVSFHVSPAETPVVRKTERKPNRRSDTAAVAIAALAESAIQDHSGPDHGEAMDTLEKSHSVVRRGGDDRLRQELLKLAARLKEENR